MNLKQLANRYHGPIRDLSGFLTVVLLFSTGVGSYRFFLVFGIYFLLKALKLEKSPVGLIFLPAFIVTFYLDVTNGPILQPSSKSHFLIILPIFFVVGTLITTATKNLIINLTDGRFFYTCPSCRFHNIQLVERCGECSYEKGVMSSLMPPEISPSFKGDDIPVSLLNLLRTSKGEEILFHKKLTTDSATFKNGLRQVRKHFLITNVNLIFLDYAAFHLRMPNSWREKDIVPISEIIAVEGKMKQRYMSPQPFIVIKSSHDDIFEMSFSHYGNYITEIKQIAAVIKEQNSHVEITMNLYEAPWKKQLGLSSIWQALLLIIFLILAVSYALWQSFIVNGIR